MRPKTVSKALLEARRFIAKGDAYLKAYREDEEDYLSERVPDTKASKEAAAVKRASMDLSRILADLRQNR